MVKCRSGIKAPFVAATEIDGKDITIANFSRLPTKCRFIAFMPQWDFLDYVAREAAKFPNFQLITQAAAAELIEEGDRIVGVRAATLGGELEIRTALVVGADGRNSIVREKAGLKIERFGSPRDVLWIKISHTGPMIHPSSWDTADRGRGSS